MTRLSDDDPVKELCDYDVYKSFQASKLMLSTAFYLQSFDNTSSHVLNVRQDLRHHQAPRAHDQVQEGRPQPR